MRKAWLYIRVSTDEQALKGYSQRNQEDRLRCFCKENNIDINQTIFEDHSAKTFDRPEWIKLQKHLNRSKTERPELILFTRWDRFSRNAGDAYYIIASLKKLGVEVQAIEQPLNLSVPENKLILALYLATSEVENDRRALNIRQGIHKAKQEGRWTSHAPKGYCNKSSSDGIKYIVPSEPEAGIIKQIFLMISLGGASIRKLHRSAVSLGLRCSLNNFWCMIRNPVYCGMISVPEFEGKKCYIVKGIHEELISKELFNAVQQVLLQRSRKHFIRTIPNNNFPLRGTIRCPICERLLTGSISKGRNRSYAYYHCRNDCTYRIRADYLHAKFHTELDGLKPQKIYADLFLIILKNVLHVQADEQTITVTQITKSIDRLFERALKAKELFYSGDIDEDDYSAIKSDCEKKINILGINIQNAALSVANASKAINKISKKLFHISDFYANAEIEIKEKIVALLLDTKVRFVENKFVEMLNDIATVVFANTNEAFPVGLKVSDSGCDLFEAWTLEDQHFYSELGKVYPNIRKNFGSMLFAYFPCITAFLKKMATLLNNSND